MSMTPREIRNDVAARIQKHIDAGERIPARLVAEEARALRDDDSDYEHLDNAGECTCGQWDALAKFDAAVAGKG